MRSLLQFNRTGVEVVAGAGVLHDADPPFRQQIDRPEITRERRPIRGNPCWTSDGIKHHKASQLQVLSYQACNQSTTRRARTKPSRAQPHPPPSIGSSVRVEAMDPVRTIEPHGEGTMETSSTPSRIGSRVSTSSVRRCGGSASDGARRAGTEIAKGMQ